MSDEIDSEIIGKALHGLKLEEGLRLPYNVSPSYSHVDTLEKWESLQWNPPHGSHFTDPDPNASPKPSWDDILRGAKIYEIDRIRYWSDLEFEPDFSDQINENITQIRRRLAGSDFIKVDESDIHVHGGIDRMTGLIHMVESATQAGAVIPHVAMRDEENNLLSFFTQSQIRPILQAVALRTNVVESAHNVVVNKYRKIAEIRDNKKANIDKRLEAAKNAHKFLKDYETHLKAAIKEYDPNALPTDLPTLKEVLNGRLEAEANKNIKRIKNAVTQQGVDLPASCDDQANAVKEISALKQSAQLLINTLDTAPKVRSAYDNAVNSMADVVPLNTPDFISPDRRLITNHKYDQVGTTPFTIKIINPSVVNSLINLEISSEGNSTHKVEYKYLNGVFLFILLTITPGTQASKVSVRARNLCGEGRKFVISVNAKA